jgi:hypothetical protein
MKIVTISIRGVEHADTYTTVQANNLSINEQGFVTFTDTDGVHWNTEVSEVSSITFNGNAQPCVRQCGKEVHVLDNNPSRIVFDYMTLNLENKTATLHLHSCAAGDAVSLEQILNIPKRA